MISCLLLFSIFCRIEFIDSWSKVEGISSKSDSHHPQKLVHSINQVLGTVSNSLNARFTLKNHNLIS